jgi:hypothetical protein
MPRTVKRSIYEPTKDELKDLLSQKGIYKKDDMREYRRLCRELSKLLFGGNAGGKHRGFHGFHSALSGRQLCIVKCRIGKEISGHQRIFVLSGPGRSSSRSSRRGRYLPENS